MTGEIVDGNAWRNVCNTISSLIPVRFAIESISCRYVKGRSVIFVVDINLFRSSCFVRSFASINVRFISSYFCGSNTSMGIFTIVSAGRDDINVKNFVIDTVTWRRWNCAYVMEN